MKTFYEAILNFALLILLLLPFSAANQLAVFAYWFFAALSVSLYVSFGLSKSFAETVPSTLKNADTNGYLGFVTGLVTVAVLIKTGAFATSAAYAVGWASQYKMHRGVSRNSRGAA